MMCANVLVEGSGVGVEISTGGRRSGVWSTSIEDTLVVEFLDLNAANGRKSHLLRERLEGKVSMLLDTIPTIHFLLEDDVALSSDCGVAGMGSVDSGTGSDSSASLNCLACVFEATTVRAKLSNCHRVVLKGLKRLVPDKSHQQRSFNSVSFGMIHGSEASCDILPLKT